MKQILTSPLIFPFATAWVELYTICTVEYFVEDGVVYGHETYIDLWNLTIVSHSKHCVYLNGIALPYIAKPREFIDSLETIYFELTGEYLP